MNGWRGKILWVDLSQGKLRTDPLDPQVAKNYIGGRGLGIHFLNQSVDPLCDPFSAENILVMATGPLTGTGVPTGARYMVMTKSPLTGAITCSNSGGMFPTEFKRTGYDAIVFTGRSQKFVYLYINQGTAELRDADHLWGQRYPPDYRHAACRDRRQSQSGLHRTSRRKTGFVRLNHE